MSVGVLPTPNYLLLLLGAADTVFAWAAVSHWARVVPTHQADPAPVEYQRDYSLRRLLAEAGDLVLDKAHDAHSGTVSLIASTMALTRLR